MKSPSLLAFAEQAALEAIEALKGGQPVRALTDVVPALLARAGSPLVRIHQGFRLSEAESGLLLLLAAQATSVDVGRALQALSPSSTGKGLAVWLACGLVAGLTSADFAASRSWRRFRLIDLEEGIVRIESHVRLDEAVLDRLAGAVPVQAELAARFRPVIVPPVPGDPRLLEAVRSALPQREEAGLSPAMLFEAEDTRAVAGALAEVGLRPFVLNAALIPDEPVAAERLAAEWSREAMLDGAALIIQADEESAVRAAHFSRRVLGHVCLIGPVRPSAMERGCHVVPAATVVTSALIDRWVAGLGPDRAARLGRHLPRIALQFRLDASEIEALCRREAVALDRAGDPNKAGALLWHAAGRAAPAIAVPGVSVIEPQFGWHDIVLAPAVEEALKRLENHVRHAATVMDDWGFARAFGGRGRGVVALLAGPSGTGKTMAAEVLASSLDLRMMVIDLSQIISKYVGETSKNIAACFRHAERSGAVMVWNEGDAIWGSRGNVASATDRHVNAETGDLLQRMESFNGFSVVTTNLRHAVDTAFLRRFRFIIDFPMPSETERLRIWRQAFPIEAPVDELDWSALSGLPLSGGSIRNVALGSAFHVAERGGRIGADAIAFELAAELRKQNLPVPVLDWGTKQ